MTGEFYLKSSVWRIRMWNFQDGLFGNNIKAQQGLNCVDRPCCSLVCNGSLSSCNGGRSLRSSAC